MSFIKYICFGGLVTLLEKFKMGYPNFAVAFHAFQKSKIIISIF